MKITDKMRIDWLEGHKPENVWASANPCDGSIQCDDGADGESRPTIRQAIDLRIKQEKKP